MPPEGDPYLPTRGMAPLTPSEARALRVVVADDTPELRLLIRVRLGRDGRFQVVGEAATGAEAVEVAARERPDLVLLDLAMPVMDGLQALPLIRERSPGTRVVVFSGVGAPQAADSAFAAGADDYVQKGTCLEALFDRLAGLFAADS